MSALPERLTKPVEYELWPEHQDALLLFLRCQTQWRTTSSGVMGLDYGVVLQLMDLYAVEDRRQTLEDLQIMEGRARELFNKAADKAAKTDRNPQRKR